MRRRELFIFIGTVLLVTVVLFSYILITLFSSGTQPTSSPAPSQNPQQSTRPFDASIAPSSTIPTPIPLPTVLPSIRPGEPNKQSLIRLMPVQTDFADIEYLSSGDTFVVTIKKNPYQESRQKVEAWFDDLGFNPTALKIYWQSYPEVIKE